MLLHVLQLISNRLIKLYCYTQSLLCQVYILHPDRRLSTPIVGKWEMQWESGGEIGPSHRRFRGVNRPVIDTTIHGTLPIHLYRVRNCKHNYTFQFQLTNYENTRDTMMSTPFRSHKSKRTSRSHKKKTDRGLPPLRIAFLGPTGQCGSCIVEELLYRGHDVVGVSRNPPEAWKEGENSAHRGVYESVAVDVRDEVMLRDVFSSGFDAIVCAFAPGIRDLKNVYENGVEGHGRVKRALLGSSHSGSFIVIGMRPLLFSVLFAPSVFFGFVC